MAQKRDVSKVKVAKGIDKLPIAKARPGAWKKMLLDSPIEEDKIHKGTEVPPIIQEAMITDVANGVAAAEIEKKYKVSLGYVRTMMLRRFGSVDGMKKALTAMSYENAIAFFGFAAANIEQMTPAQAVLSGKLSVDTGLALEKAAAGKPEEIDFSGLLALGNTISRVEKIITGTDRTLPAT